jgi:hypothetical protein
VAMKMMPGNLLSCCQTLPADVHCACTPTNTGWHGQACFEFCSEYLRSSLGMVFLLSLMRRFDFSSGCDELDLAMASLLHRNVRTRPQKHCNSQAERLHPAPDQSAAFATCGPCHGGWPNHRKARSATRRCAQRADEQAPFTFGR